MKIFNCYILTSSTVSGHLGCFSVLIIVNSAARNIEWHVLFWIRVFFLLKENFEAFFWQKKLYLENRANMNSLAPVSRDSQRWGVLVHLDCDNRMLWLGWLKQQNIFLLFWRLASPGSGCQHDQFLVRALPLIQDNCLLPVAWMYVLNVCSGVRLGCIIW